MGVVVSHPPGPQVTIGENEVASGTVNLKDIVNSVEAPVPRVELVARLTDLIRARAGAPAPQAGTGLAPAAAGSASRAPAPGAGAAAAGACPCTVRAGLLAPCHASTCTHDSQGGVFAKGS
jgi:hypothetical protein